MLAKLAAEKRMGVRLRQSVGGQPLGDGLQRGGLPGAVFKGFQMQFVAGKQVVRSNAGFPFGRGGGEGREILFPSRASSRAARARASGLVR